MPVELRRGWPIEAEICQPAVADEAGHRRGGRSSCPHPRLSGQVSANMKRTRTPRYHMANRTVRLTVGALNLNRGWLRLWLERIGSSALRESRVIPYVVSAYRYCIHSGTVSVPARAPVCPVCPVCVRNHTQTHIHIHTSTSHTKAGPARGRVCPGSPRCLFTGNFPVLWSKDGPKPRT